MHNDATKEQLSTLLGRIETAVGQIPDRDGQNAVLIAEILQAVNGLRSVLGVPGQH